MHGSSISIIVYVSVIAIAWSSITHAALPQTCIALLSDENDETSSLIAYLARLIESREITNIGLSRFLQELKSDHVSNPISEEEAAIKVSAHIHREGLEEKLTKKNLNKPKLKSWVEAVVREQGRVRRERTETEEETRAPSIKNVEFVPIRPAKFKRGKDKAEVELTHEVEVMSTPVTQMQWVTLFGENPSHFKTGQNMIYENVSRGRNTTPTKVALQPDHPVENITWWSALFAANKFSEKYGLKPVYDFKDAVWTAGTRFEDGTLTLESGVVRINAPDGNIYSTEGFRLPTAAEQDYLLELESKANGSFEGSSRAWLGENSHGSTQPVGLLRPLLLDQKPIYDLYGNVSEWAQDSTSFSAEHSGGKDPIHSEGDARMATGASWHEQNNVFMRRENRHTSPYPNTRNMTIGVRFVRTIASH